MTATLTNLVDNPSAEVNVTGAGSSNTTSLTRDTAQASVGLASYKCVWNGAGVGSFYMLAYSGARISTGIVAGSTYTWRIRVYDVSLARNWFPRIEWYNAALGLISAVNGTTSISTLGAWTEYIISATAPALTVYATPMMQMSGVPTAAHVTHFDCALLCVSSAYLTAYFDGSYADPTLSVVTTQAWVGTAHQSNSTITLAAITVTTFTAVLSSDGRAFNLAVNAPDFITATISRRVGSAAATSTTVVRGSNGVALSGIGALNVRDVEAPQNTAVFYQLVVTRPTPAYTYSSAWIQATGLIQFGASVLFDLATSGAPTKVLVNAWEQFNHDLPTDTVWIDGRPDPVVIGGGKRLPNGVLTILTQTNLEYDAVMLAISNGITCFAPQFPDRAGDTDGLTYMSITNVKERRMTMKKDNPARYLDITYQEIIAPPADYVPVTARTWDYAYGLGMFWDALASAYTWDQLAGYA